ncbi:MAG: YwbE family protein [Methanobacterium sp.]|nr:YwbE family protein [Methanobacterium sp.]
MSQKNGKNRKDIKIGSEVYIVLKKDQRSGKRTKGIVKDLLTRSSSHPHGIKVRLEDGRIGRVQEIIK